MVLGAPTRRWLLWRLGLRWRDGVNESASLLLLFFLSVFHYFYHFLLQVFWIVGDENAVSVDQEHSRNPLDPAGCLPKLARFLVTRDPGLRIPEAQRLADLSSCFDFWIEIDADHLEAVFVPFLVHCLQLRQSRL